MRKNVKKLVSRSGFTLVELVVVIAVLAILAGIGSLAYSGYIKNANQAKDLAVLEAVETAAKSAVAKVSGVDGITLTLDSSDNKTIKGVTLTLSSGHSPDAPDSLAIGGTGDYDKLFSTLLSGNDKNLVLSTAYSSAVWTAESREWKLTELS